MTDPEERQRFVKSVPLAAIKISRLGTWTWSAESPYPAMDRLLTAPFWVADRWSELRASFMDRREPPTCTISSDQELAEVLVPRDEQQGEPPRRVLAYKVGAAIPAAAMGIPVGLVVINALPQTLPGLCACV